MPIPLSAPLDSSPILNVNVGLMGHVDAGKTALARFLSTHASTAAFDKHPASQKRGITLDLGFSMFSLPPTTTTSSTDPSDKVKAHSIDQVDTATIKTSMQVTLVDCPGHASLFKMVLGAANIIDAIILVIDAQAGIQTQTAECLVLAEILWTWRQDQRVRSNNVTSNDNIPLIIALTKIDRFEEAERRQKILEISSKILKTLQTTSFREKIIPIIPISPHLPDTRNHFLSALSRHLRLVTGNPSLVSSLINVPTIVAIDHTFTIKGQAGTILTGTILQGELRVGDQVELSALRCIRPIKAIQSFHRSISSAGPGSRIGINLGGSTDLFREQRSLLVSPPNHLHPTSRFWLEDIRRVMHYRQGPIKSRYVWHVAILHELVLARITFARRDQKCQEDSIYEEELSSNMMDSPIGTTMNSNGLLLALVEVINGLKVVAPTGFLTIGARLDLELDRRACRLAFSGSVLDPSNPVKRIYRWKEKWAPVDRIVDGYRLIGRELTAKPGGLPKFVGMECQIMSVKEITSPEIITTGRVDSSFGTSGKFNVVITGTTLDATHHLPRSLRILLRYKKYYNHHK